MQRITPLKANWRFAARRWLEPPQKLGHSKLEWHRATVPGAVHLDLVKAGIIADPFVACHELGCQWVDDEDWVYRTEFEYEPDPRLPKRLLRFEGLDTVCRLYLNDELVAEHDNMFVPLELDVSDRLVRGTNQLRVEFFSAWRVGSERRARYFESQAIASNTVRFDARAFVRKAQYMYGWDWGPRLISCGLFRPVSLVEHAGRLLDVQIEQRHLPDGTVEVCCHTDSEHAEGLSVFHFVEGFDEPLRDGQWLRIAAPRLWWPNGMGQADLYEVVSILGGERPLTREDVTCARDRKTQRIGLRTVELVQEPDAHGTSFRFRVNGRELYALGANWIPDDNFVSRVERERLKAQLERARDLGMNMLRVWGGGYYESDEFYELADVLGLLVWQDFPYACSYYPDDDEACEVARGEASCNVRRLRNHPSLALWCGNNENDTMRDSGWEGMERHPARYEGERLYRQVLPEVLSKLDPGRAYIPSSPFGGARANDGGVGDQHYWDVWHGRGDYSHYVGSQARFCSEFGFASAASHATMRRLDPTRDSLNVDVRDPIVRWHDKTDKGYDTFLGFVEMHYPPSQTVEEWTYYSQLNQRDALRFGIEHYRRGRACRGTLIWQLNDCWPVQSWAVIDSSFRYKAAAFELVRLYASLLISLERVGRVLRIWGVLDNVEVARVTHFRLEVRQLVDGALLTARELAVTLQPGERRVLEELTLEAQWEQTAIVTVQGDAPQTFLLLPEPKALRLQALPLTVERSEECLLVSIPGPVVDLCFWDEQGEVVFLDNFITRATAGCIQIRYQGTLTQVHARSLGGRHLINFI